MEDHRPRPSIETNERERMPDSVEWGVGLNIFAELHETFVVNEEVES